MRVSGPIADGGMEGLLRGFSIVVKRGGNYQLIAGELKTIRGSGSYEFGAGLVCGSYTVAIFSAECEFVTYRRWRNKSCHVR